jgi:hypothetical protein
LESRTARPILGAKRKEVAHPGDSDIDL